MSRLPIWNPCHPWRALSLGAVLLLQTAVSAAATLPGALVGAAEEAVEHAYFAELDALERRLFAALSEAAPDMATELAALAGQQAAMVSDAQVARQQYQRELRTFLKRREALRAESVALTEAAAALKAAQANSESLRADYVKRYGDNESASDPAVIRAVEVSNTLVASTRELANAAEAYRVLGAQVKASEHPLQRRSRTASDEFNSMLARHTATVTAQRQAQADAVRQFDGWWTQQKQTVEQAQAAIDGAFAAYSKYRAAAIVRRDELAQAVMQYNDAVEKGMAETEVAALRAKVDAAQAEFDAALASTKAAQSSMSRAENEGKKLIARVTREREARAQVLAAAKAAMGKRHRESSAELATRRAVTAAQVADNEAALGGVLEQALTTVREARAALTSRYGEEYEKLHGALKLWLEYRDSGELLALTTESDSELAGLRALVRESKNNRTGAGAQAERIRAALADLAAAQARYGELQQNVSRLGSGMEDKAVSLVASFRDWSGRLNKARGRLNTALDAFAAKRPQLKSIRGVAQGAAGIIGLELAQLIAVLNQGTPESTAENWKAVNEKLRGLAGEHPRLLEPWSVDVAPVAARLGTNWSTSRPFFVWANRAVQNAKNRLDINMVTAMGVPREAASTAVAAALGGGLEWGVATAGGANAQMLAGDLVLTADGQAKTR